VLTALAALAAVEAAASLRVDRCVGDGGRWNGPAGACVPAAPR
jgi:hypothetical protein